MGDGDSVGPAVVGAGTSAGLASGASNAVGAGGASAAMGAQMYIIVIYLIFFPSFFDQKSFFLPPFTCNFDVLL